MTDLRVDAASSGRDFDPAAEEELRQRRVHELQARLASPTNYAGRAADEAELAHLESDQAARRDLQAGRANVVPPEVGNAAKLTLHQHGLVALPKLESPDMTTPAWNMSGSQRRRQIDLLRQNIGKSPQLAPPAFLQRLNELERAEAAAQRPPPKGFTPAPYGVNPETATDAQLDAEIRHIDGGGAVPMGVKMGVGAEAYRQQLGEEALLRRPGGLEILLRVHAGDPAAQKRLLAHALQRVGGDPTCKPGDSVQTLLLRYYETVGAKSRASNDAVRAMPTMGDKGLVFANADEAARYEAAEKVIAMNPGTTLGSIAAAWKAMSGGSLDDMRAAGSAGNELEGTGGGVGTVLQAGRGAHHDTTQRPHVGLVHDPKRPPPAGTHAASPSLAPAKGANGTGARIPPAPLVVPPGTRVPIATRDGQMSVVVPRAAPNAPEVPRTFAPPTQAAPTTAPRRGPPPKLTPEQESAKWYASQRLPSGRHWRDATFEEFVAMFRKRNPGDRKTDTDLWHRYQLGERVSPEFGKLRDMRGAAVYAKPPNRVADSDVAGASGPAMSIGVHGVPTTTVSIESLRQKWAEVQQQWAIAKGQYQTLKRSGVTGPQLTAAETAYKSASRTLGEVGGQLYVASRYPGPPPPELIFPAPGTQSEQYQFDRVYRIAPKYGKTLLVVEEKGGERASLERRNVAGGDVQQGTKRYLDATIAAMQKNGYPVAEELEKRNHDIVYIQASSTGGPPATVTGQEFDLTADTGVRPRQP